MAVAKPASTYVGTKYTVPQVIPLLYRGGFRTYGDLLAITAIAVAESSLWQKARNWHPEYGFRPAADTLGVVTPQAPDGAYSSTPVTPGDPVPTPVTGTPYVQQLNSDRGILQISSWWWKNHPSAGLVAEDATCDDPVLVGPVARQIMVIEGTGFNVWDTYESGVAQTYYDTSIGGWPPIRPLVAKFLASTRGPRIGRRRGVRMGSQ